MQNLKQKMQELDNDNSNMFKVDDSQEHVYQNQEKIQQRLNNMFDKDKKIHVEGQKKMVVYGNFQEQPRTIYEIVQPYIAKAASLTGQAAVYAGKNIYHALSVGANWVYDKFVNTVVPYAAEQIPKLMFIIKGNKNKEEKNLSSDSFHVLEIEDQDYDKIKKKQKNVAKKRIIVPLGKQDDPQFIKFLQRQKYVENTSFPIDTDEEDDEQETFLIPSANFMVLHNQAIVKNLPQPVKNIQPEHRETEQIQIKQQTKQEEKIQKQKQEEEHIMKSIIESKYEQKQRQIQDYKRVEKKVFKLKDCYIFELEGRNSIEYQLLDGIQKDENTKCGYLVKSNKFNIAKSQIESDSDGNSGQVPLLIEKFQNNKVVDMQRKVRVQIPEVKKEHKIDEIQRQLELA